MRAHKLAFPLLLLSLSAPFAQADEPKIAAVLQPYVDSHSLAGAVTLVASKEKVLSVDAVGYADVGAKKPMTADSVFWIASMSKPITGTALMLLVDEGKVNIDDPVEKYLPEFRGQMVIAYQDDSTKLLKRPKHPITVKNVLSHTSGLPFRSAIEQPTLDGLPLREAVLSYALTPLESEPDSKYQYSNAGINTAGRIIEVVSGMPYEQFLEERLFKPLGMKDTTFWPNEEQVSRLAKSYKPNAAKDNLEEIQVGQLLYPLSDHSRRFPMPAGGYFSTAGDMGRFCQMLLNGGTFEGRRYLSEAALKQMVSKQTGDNLKDGYGLGWSVSPTSFGHGGAHATNMNVDTQRGLVTVWMIQHAGFPGNGGQAQGAFQQAAAAFAK
jgi:CubicO group peptidase (beta-lactamase class C family)